jgi:hypothetical protein
MVDVQTSLFSRLDRLKSDIRAAKQREVSPMPPSGEKSSPKRNQPQTLAGIPTAIAIIGGVGVSYAVYKSVVSNGNR